MDKHPCEILSLIYHFLYLMSKHSWILCELVAHTFLAPSGAQEMLMFVRLSFCLMKVCLELSFFIFLSQVSLRSVSGQSQVSLRSVSGQSQVSPKSLLGLS